MICFTPDARPFDCYLPAECALCSPFVPIKCLNACLCLPICLNNVGPFYRNGIKQRWSISRYSSLLWKIFFFRKAKSGENNSEIQNPEEIKIRNSVSESELIKRHNIDFFFRNTCIIFRILGFNIFVFSRFYFSGKMFSVYCPRAPYPISDIL